ncbi:glycosyltransferase family 2 protein [Usitatibacter palustris]|uniref:Glycosyltransferase 2-like domain-containing protein n=1 Tax=Usitatibacter palustris TaxID=2732487 RepID=A0A6M4H7M1_9PROT|nr:glycosyltransferase [Usitatibacter palustris]QJR15560.1 hypothetical protein DSM104440_02382 [Usitatibacter palustris]
MIDVIVPVYRGLGPTQRCLESVIAASGSTLHELIVIDDESPEPQITQWLSTFAREHRVALRRHEKNRGFVATVNEGMALHPTRDVVLLNADTEVPRGWLDRLAAHARGANVGTVTPFSNNATICSYPRFCENNELPAGMDTHSLDAAFHAANAGRSVDILTAVGFCMYIRRECLDRVGLFDFERYGQGYGEEVDFCMRASRAGFRHLLAGDLFVYHQGEVSFGNTGVERRAQAQRTVDTLYPEFQPTVRAFVQADPPRPLREAVDRQRGVSSSR